MSQAPDPARAGARPASAGPTFISPAPELMRTIGGGEVVAVDAQAGFIRLAFDVRREFCHSNGTVAQGGFITAWLDAAMAHAIMVRTAMQSNVASLEIKVMFLQAVGPGKVFAEGQVIRAGKRVVFLEGRLFDASETLVATATSTGMLVPLPPPAIA